MVVFFLYEEDDFMNFHAIFIGCLSSLLFSVTTIAAEKEAVTLKIKNSSPCNWDVGNYLGHRGSERAITFRTSGPECLFSCPKEVTIGDKKINFGFEERNNKVRVFVDLNADGNRNGGESFLKDNGLTLLKYALGQEEGNYWLSFSKVSDVFYGIRSGTSFAGSLGKLPIQVLDANGDGQVFVKKEEKNSSSNSDDEPFVIGSQGQQNEGLFQGPFVERDFLRLGSKGIWMPINDKYLYNKMLYTFSLPQKEKKEPLGTMTVLVDKSEAIKTLPVTIKCSPEIRQGAWVIYHEELKFFTTLSHKTTRCYLPAGKYKIFASEIKVGTNARNMQTWRTATNGVAQGDFTIEADEKNTIQLGLTLVTTKRTQGDQIIFRITTIAGKNGEVYKMDKKIDLKNFDVYAVAKKSKSAKLDSVSYG